MSESSEEVTIKVNKSKKVDCNISELIEPTATEGHNNDINLNDKTCTSDENGKESLQSSGDESSKAGRMDSPEPHVNTNSSDIPEVEQNSTDLSKVSDEEGKNMDFASHNSTKEDNIAISHEDLSSQMEDAGITNSEINKTIDVDDKQNNTIEESGNVIEENDIVNKESDNVVEENDIVSKESDKAIEENDIVNKESDNVVEENDIVNKESDKVIEENDIVNKESDTIDRGSNNVEESNIVDKENDIVNKENDTAEKEDDATDQDDAKVDKDADSIVKESDTVNKDADSVDNDIDTVEHIDPDNLEDKSTDIVPNEDSDTVKNSTLSTADASSSIIERDSEKISNNVDEVSNSETTAEAMEVSIDESQPKSNMHENTSQNESMDVDSNSLNSTDAGASSESLAETELSSKEESSSKIKLRSFASLCVSSDKKPSDANAEKTSPEIEGVSVGDIVQHSNIVQPDESGVLHLKISDVVGKEECITGVLEDDTLSSLQITSVVSLTEPLSPEEPQDNAASQLRIASIGTVTDSSITTIPAKDKKAQMVIIQKNRLVVPTVCISCRKVQVCIYRIWYKPPKPYIKCPYLCSEKCRDNFVSLLPANQKLEKPTRFFERLCSMCDKTLSINDIVHWQTREFCNKLCLADHIGEVAKYCYECKSAVKVLFMGKYCVRFGSDIHQFCSHHCLESYKIKFDSCSYCQKNLEHIDKVINEPPKKYCSIMCMRRSQREDIGQLNYTARNNCTVCQKSKINQYEFVNKNDTVLLCSNPCLSVYKYVNQAKAVNCCMCSRFVNADDFPNYFYTNSQLRVFCSESCLSVFIITARRVVSCQYCKVKKYNFDMIQKGCMNSFFCSICCLNLLDTDRGKQAVEPVQPEPTANAKDVDQEPILKVCQMCNKNLPAQFHMVMSDSTLRSFCSYNCACKFKCSFGYQVSGINVPSKDNTIPTDTSIIQTNNSVVAKKVPTKQPTSSKVDFQALANILKEFEPPEMSNKCTSCKPNTTSRAIQSTSEMCNKGVQTDEDGAPPFVSVPFPTFIPTPMMMYSANVPIPIIVPLPIPVPVFIPTTEKTTEDILKRMNKIQNEIPDDPIQADLLLLAKGQEAEMQQELESQLTEEDLQTPQMVLEEPDEILTFMDNDEDLSVLDDSIHKFSCEGDEPKKGKKKRRSYDDDGPPSKKQKTSEPKTDDTLNASYGLSVWVDWVRKKNVELKEKFNGGLINEDLVQINSEAMNECLSMFISDLEEKDDRAYEIDTIFYLLLGLQKVMFERGSTFCIFLEDRFEKFRCTFDKMITAYLKKQFNSEIIGFQLLNGSRVTEDMLWQCRQLGAHTPYVLLNTLFYFSTKCFKLRTVEDHMAVSFSQVIKQWRRACIVEGSYTRTTLLKYFPRQAHFDKTELEMHENRVDPLKCPVKLYEFYLSKCPESVRSQQGLYYIYPETCCMPDSPVWFSTGALDAITIERMLNRVQLVKEIQEALYH